MWEQVVGLFREYMGTGLIVGLFLMSLIYLCLKEKRKNFRILLVYVPVVLLLLFFNPLFAGLLYRFIGDEIYYRLLWLIPMTPSIAYAMALLYGGLRGKVRIAFAGLCVCVIMLSGSFIYANPYFSRAENLYHMPQSVVDICDAIRIDGREVMALFPRELLQYVRQYSPVICMPYGREQLVSRWGASDPLYVVMEERETVNVEELSRLAKERMCHYVVLSEEKELDGDMRDYDYALFGRIDGYLIYRDTTMYFGLWDEEGAAAE